MAPSESVADADTIDVSGPSGKMHWNDPAVSLFESERTLVPLAPQLVVTA